MKYAVIIGALGAFFVSSANAEPQFARMFKSRFGYVPSCNACHKDGGGTPLNAYGEQWKDAGMDNGAFKTIADLDGDADGHPNEAEAAARANPGDKGSTPDDPGAWLDISNLIPKDVQKLFPGIRAYLPKDAILTDKEIARAAKLGVALNPSDENTIYIPVENKRPVGTAIIVPAVHEGKQFFLVVATDRKLAIQSVVPTNTQHVPAAESSGVYKTLVGKTVTTLDAPASPTNVDDAIRLAAKKGLTLTYVRLKKE